MSRILRRPMFRGGRVSSYGNGIATGLANGGRVNYAPGGSVLEKYKSVREEIGEPERKGLSTGDYLRIASAGMDILGAPSQGGGIKGLLASAAKPLSSLGTDLGSSMDTRAAAAAKKRDELSLGLTGLEIEREIGMQKAKGVLGFKETLINDMFNPDIEEALANGDKAAAKQLQKDKQDYIEKYVIRGIDDSDFLAILKNQTALDQAEGDARRIMANTENPNSKEIPKANWKTTDAGYTVAKNVQKLDILKSTSQFMVEQETIETKADGGPVGMMTEDVNVMEQTPGGIADVNIQETETMDPNNPQPMQISYEQLRARLPKEIGDDIVTLLANSYEALADFSAISTQADVDNFNIRYGVELVLPQEA